MVRSSAESYDFNFDDDIGLEDGSPSVRAPTSLDYSTTSDVSGVIIYTHGCSVRVRFCIETPAALEALRRCGWSEEPTGKTWKVSTPGLGRRRYVLRGSKWLNERPPANERLPLVRFNRTWKTRIYSLGIEVGADVHVDLQVVRHDDIGRFFVDVLGLGASDYEVKYYRTAERFFVLPPHEAFRFARELGAHPSDGRGRLGRKRRLVKDFEIPLTIRKRSKAKAVLVVYRIDRGATAAFKVEARLRGQRNGRGEFRADDIAKLDGILLDLIRRHDLHPIPKPARWEPRTFTTSVERSSFDPYIKQIPQRAWRGTQVSKGTRALVQKCHTPSVVRLAIGTEKADVYPARTRIRSNLPSLTDTNGVHGQGSWKLIEKSSLRASRYGHERDEARTRIRRPDDPWARIVHDMTSSSLYLFEVILDAEQSPRSLLEALGAGALGKIGVAALCAADAAGNADTWRPVIEAANKHPVDGDDIDTLVLAVDPTAALDLSAAVVATTEAEVNDGSFGKSEFEFGTFGRPLPEFDPLARWWHATGAWLFDLFAELRRHCEETGLRLVVITADARPDHGRGPIQRSHFFRDGRVRSTIGDAGRYACHQRYLVERGVRTTTRAGYIETTDEDGETFVHEHNEVIEDEYITDRVVVVKDEAEGLVGRIIYER